MRADDSGKTNAMPLSVPDLPAAPECGGKQWSVLDDDALATVVALVLVGRAKHAEDVLAGAQVNVAIVADALKEQLRRLLQAPAGALELPQFAYRASFWNARC
jgi:hypothetical protein